MVLVVSCHCVFSSIFSTHQMGVLIVFKHGWTISFTNLHLWMTARIYWSVFNAWLLPLHACNILHYLLCSTIILHPDFKFRLNTSKFLPRRFLDRQIPLDAKRTSNIPMPCLMLFHVALRHRTLTSILILKTAMLDTSVAQMSRNTGISFSDRILTNSHPTISSWKMSHIIPAWVSEDHWCPILPHLSIEMKLATDRSY